MTTKKTAKPARSPKKSGTATSRTKKGAATSDPNPVASTESEKKQPKPRTDTKQAKLIEMLKGNRGTTIEEIAKTFDWQQHTVRGALAGGLKKRLGLTVTSEKVEGRGRVYRLAD